jgi:DNA-binding MarR family transcriptional regulator
MPIDALIANPGRLRILTALVREPRQEFVRLRSVTQMTDGNLTTHARRLHSAGMLEIDKSIRDGKPVTTYTLTGEGRQAFVTHVEMLVESLNPQLRPSATSNPSMPVRSELANALA